MEIIQGKLKDKKVVIAQEIAFAKVLAGNNKTLRDRAVKKLRKWLTVRGNGKWAFTEEEFLRIWTGLFYCMWMSDKFLVQEELAESISNLIHCFKKNSNNALLFIKCFHKRMLMDYEGLDQYRIDKFNMLVRRFLRQTFVYCKEKDWNKTFLYKLMDIFFNVVLHRNNSLGFVLHFISIYAEELAKVSRGKLENKTTLILIEPFVKLVSRTKEIRIRKEAEDFFDYLVRQTDIGIEFDEKFNAWREQGFPGEGPHQMISSHSLNGNDKMSENEDDFPCEEEEDVEDKEQLMDPRAGSVHVLLPQIPIHEDEIINLFKKHQNSKHVNVRGKRILKSLCEKFETLKKGRFPARITKDPILTEKRRKTKETKQKAAELLEFTQKLDENPIKTEEFKDILRKLEEQNSADDEIKENDDVEQAKERPKKTEKKKNNSPKNLSQVNGLKEEEKVSKKKKVSTGESKRQVSNHKENVEQRREKKKKQRIRKRKEKNSGKSVGGEEIIVTPVKKRKINGVAKDVEEDADQVTIGTKRKVLSTWQVQELDSSSPEYYKIKTPKVIRIERKTSESFTNGESGIDEAEDFDKKEVNGEETPKETPKETIVPVFWEKAREKAGKKSGKKSKVFLNPFAKIDAESKCPGRRISFALDKNMAQENEEYLEEVKNSPRVPFDGTKKPVQSALKSGLPPSPVNPFYRFKKIKF